MSGGLSTPGQVLGEGPDGYKFPLAGTQETLGGAGAKRSPPDTYASGLYKIPKALKQKRDDRLAIPLFM